MLSRRHYQLSGDEGIRKDNALKVWMVGPIIGKPLIERTELEPGQICEIQDEFKPTNAELLFGTLQSRRPAAKLPPLEARLYNERDPEEFEPVLRGKTVDGKRRALADHIAILQGELESLGGPLPAARTAREASSKFIHRSLSSCHLLSSDLC